MKKSFWIVLEGLILAFFLAIFTAQLGHPWLAVGMFIFGIIGGAILVWLAKKWATRVLWFLRIATALMAINLFAPVLWKGVYLRDLIGSWFEGNTVPSQFQVLTIILETPSTPGWQTIFLIDEDGRPLTIHKGDYVHFWTPNPNEYDGAGRFKYPTAQNWSAKKWEVNLLITFKDRLVTFEKNGRFFLKKDWTPGGPDIPTTRSQDAPYGVPGRPLVAMVNTSSSRAQKEKLEFFSPDAAKGLVGMTIEHGARCGHNYKVPSRRTPAGSNIGTVTTMK